MNDTIVRAFDAMKRVIDAGRYATMLYCITLLTLLCSILRDRVTVPIKYPVVEVVVISKVATSAGAWCCRLVVLGDTWWCLGWCWGGAWVVPGEWDAIECSRCCRRPT